MAEPVVAIDRLTSSVEAGELFALLGANGAGKTVTMKMLTTLLPPTSGNATVAGFDIVHHAADVRRVIGYVPQLVSTDGNLTGYENLRIFARRYDLARTDREARVEEALVFMDLVDDADKLVRHSIVFTTHLMDEARLAIMHRGAVAARGTPAELKASTGRSGATLDDVFVHYAGGQVEAGGGYRDASSARRTAQRLG